MLVSTYRERNDHQSETNTPVGKSFNWLLDKSLLPTNHHNKMLALNGYRMLSTIYVSWLEETLFYRYKNYKNCRFYFHPVNSLYSP